MFRFSLCLEGEKNKKKALICFVGISCKGKHVVKVRIKVCVSMCVFCLREGEIDGWSLVSIVSRGEGARPSKGYIFNTYPE